MKIKLLVSMAIAAAVGSNAFAVQITKGKLVSHKEWTTGGAVAAYLPGTKSLDSLLRDKSMMKQTRIQPYHYVSADTAPVHGLVGEALSISNDAYVYAYNGSNEIQKYSYTFDICTNRSEHINECVYTFDEIELQPGGNFYNASQPVLKVKFDKPGTYQTIASSYIFSNGLSSGSASIADITVA